MSEYIRQTGLAEAIGYEAMKYVVAGVLPAECPRGVLVIRRGLKYLAIEPPRAGTSTCGSVGRIVQIVIHRLPLGSIAVQLGEF